MVCPSSSLTGKCSRCHVCIAGKRGNLSSWEAMPFSVWINNYVEILSPPKKTKKRYSKGGYQTKQAESTWVVGGGGQLHYTYLFEFRLHGDKVIRVLWCRLIKKNKYKCFVYYFSGNALPLHHLPLDSFRVLEREWHEWLRWHSDPLFRLPPNPRQHTRGCTYHFHPLPHIIPQPTISAFKYLRVGEEARTFIDTIKDALDARVVREVFLGRAPSTSRLRWDRSPSNRVCNDSLSSIFLKKNLTLKLFEVFK